MPARTSSLLLRPSDFAAAFKGMLEDRVRIVKPEVNRLKVSEWAASSRVLPQGLTSLPGAFSWEVTPYLKEIADCLSESSPVQKLVLMKGSRIGATVGVGENWIGYVIACAPGPMMYVGADKESAEAGMELRLDAMIQSAGLADLIFSQVEKPHGKKTGDKKSRKDFPGGFLMAIGPNVAAKLRSFGIRYAFLDEVDAYPQETGKEGDPILLVERRTDEYESIRKLFYASTPLVEQTSRIKTLFEAGDQRRYFVPCKYPDCGHMQPLVWRDKDGKYRLEYETDASGRLVPGSVHYVCEKCGRPWKNADKEFFLTKGEWRATAQASEPHYRSYHISSLYSPLGMRSWESIAREWLKAKDNPSKLRVFVNTCLGETWVEKGEAPSFEKIMLRRDAYEAGTLPSTAKAIFLTASADVQEDRIEAEFVAWGRDKESWSVEYLVFHGKTEFVDGEPWREFCAALEAPHAGLIARAAVIDSKHHTRTVYQFCETLNNCYPIAGDNRVGKVGGRIFMLKKVDEFSKLRRIDLFAHELKRELYAALRMAPPEPGQPCPGYCHFPSSYSDRYFKQLVSEEYVKTQTKTGGILMQWRTMHGRRNEAHDVRIYGMALLLVMQAQIAEEIFERDIETREFWDWAEATFGVHKIEKLGGKGE